MASFWARWWPRLAWPLALVVLLLVLLNILQSWQYFIGLVNLLRRNLGALHQVLFRFGVAQALGWVLAIP